jgi:uncharacterized protein
MRRRARLLLFCILVCGVGFAQQAGNTPATKEDVEKLFNTMHIRQQMHNMMEVMSKQSRQMAQNTLKKKFPEMTEKDMDRLNDFTDRIWSQMDFDGMLDDMVPVYQRHLTKEDVSAMQSFYETPTGQKLLREQPQMTAEAMQAMQPRMEKMMSSVMEQAEKMAKEAATTPKPVETNKN